MARAGPKKKRPKAKRLTPEEQHARFVETAKEVEADEVPDAIDKAMRKIVIRQSGPYSPRKRAKP